MHCFSRGGSLRGSRRVITSLIQKPHFFHQQKWGRWGGALQYSCVSMVAQMVKNVPTMWETWVRSLGWENPLEEGLATHCSILAWKSPWTEEPGGLY